MKVFIQNQNKIYLFHLLVIIYADTSLTVEHSNSRQARLQLSNQYNIKPTQKLIQLFISSSINATTRNTVLQTSQNYSKQLETTQNKLLSSILSTPSKVISRNTSSSTRTLSTACIKTPVGGRKCQPFTGSFCMNVLKLQNITLISRNCSSDSIAVDDNKLKKIFYLLEATFEAEENCLKAAKWLACSTIFPSCIGTSSLLQMPCAESCDVIKGTICSRRWHGFISLQETFLDDIIISNCKKFSSEATNQCLYPQFIKDIIDPDSILSKSMELIIGVSVGAVFTFLILFIATILCCRKKKSKKLERQVSMKEIKEVHGNVETNNTIVDILGETSPEYDSIERLVDALGLTVFTKEHLTFDENLGEGAFGKVVRCKTRNMGHTFNIDLVAVKYLKQNPSKEMERTFNKEVEILSNFDHPNVIPLVGVCLEGPMCLVLEFMKYGDLSHYIRIRSGSYHAVAGSYGNLPDGVEFSAPELSFHNLLLITNQIADGVSYLATKRFVHRDIASRNILVGEDLQVKISDFGLAHDIYGSDYYRVDTQKMLPLRWLSPEALSLGKFTVKSDIWAFGVTMWEIFTYGMQPFYGCNNEEVCYRIRCHKNLERPYCCPQKIYELMKSCWKFEPLHRKSASYVKNTITKWLDDKEDFIQDSWQRLLLPPLPDRRPTIKKAKLKYLNIRHEITL